VTSTASDTLVAALALHAAAAMTLYSKNVDSTVLWLWHDQHNAHELLLFSR
jgi:hypothetical protein